MIQISIMAVPERKDMVEELVISLAKEGFQTKTFFDEEHKGPWFNMKWILESTDFSASHHLVIQDDGKISSNFRENLERIANVTKDRFVGVFFVHQHVKGMLENGETFYQVTDWNMGFGVATLYPTCRIKEYLNWVEKRHWHHDADDLRLLKYLEFKEEKLLGAVPSLVQHVGKSSTKEHLEYIKASVFLGEKTPVIDWKFDG